MPTRRETRIRHAQYFSRLLRALTERETHSSDGLHQKLTALDDVWPQIAAAHGWAQDNAANDLEAQQLVAAFEQGGVELAQVQAETRSALRSLKLAVLQSTTEFASDFQEPLH